MTVRGTMVYSDVCYTQGPTGTRYPTRTRNIFNTRSILDLFSKSSGISCIGVREQICPRVPALLCMRKDRQRESFNSCRLDEQEGIQAPPGFGPQNFRTIEYLRKPGFWHEPMCTCFNIDHSLIFVVFILTLSIFTTLYFQIFTCNGDDIEWHDLQRSYQ